MTEQTMNQAVRKLAENYNQLEQSLVNRSSCRSAEPPVGSWATYRDRSGKTFLG